MDLVSRFNLGEFNDVDLMTGLRSNEDSLTAQDYKYICMECTSAKAKDWAAVRSN